MSDEPISDEELEHIEGQIMDCSKEQFEEVKRAMIEIEARQAAELMRENLDRLARAGITTSLCYGPTPGPGPEWVIRWSVDCMTPDQDSFARPFAASTMEQAVEIAIIECTKRGWLK